MMFLEIQNSTKFASVDDEDWKRLSHFKWNDSGTSIYRAIWTGVKRVNISLAREILKCKIIVDHINRDYLSNVKSNLRQCNQSLNMANKTKKTNCSSKFKGLCWNKPAQKWQVRICVNQKRIALGNYTDELIAAKAYNDAALKYFGQFAILNKI